MITHLQGNIPGHVHMALKLIHPNLSNSEGISPHVGGQVVSVGFVSPLNVGDASTGQDLNTAATLPHLVIKVSQKQRKEHNRHSSTTTTERQVCLPFR